MTKSDLRLVEIVSIVCVLTIMLPFFFQKNGEKVALVYYKNQLIQTIPISNNQLEYQVMGENGMVTIETKDGKIRVKEENSPLHLCSKQGYIQKSTETIVCLPNKIVIKIEEKDSLDTVVR